MKKIIFITFLIFGTAFATHAQKYGYIDSDYILENIPQYVEAKEELDKFAMRWQKEIDDLYKQIDKRRNEFLRVEAILPEEERAKRKEEIEKMETDALGMQQTRFGINGELFSKRRELIEPIQDEVFDALEKVASKRNYAFIFDKANQSNLIFADPKYDVSKMVLREMKISIKDD